MNLSAKSWGLLVALYVSSFGLFLASCSGGKLQSAGEVSSLEYALDRPTEIALPYLERAPIIDGDLSDWKLKAHHDGVWDMHRLRHTSWYDPEKNRLTDHGGEPSIEEDLNARYYMAWDDTYFYMGAEVHDNVNDVSEENHEPKRWYYKDSICWFIEAPADEVSEKFGRGNNAFCFVIDASRPDHGAWWRHGTDLETYVEEPIPNGQFEYQIKMNPWGRSEADYILEARVAMEATFGVSDIAWTQPEEGDVYSVEIVHTDPDGGNYGGHFLIYGSGDDDASWAKMILSSPSGAVERKEN